MYKQRINQIRGTEPLRMNADIPSTTTDIQYLIKMIGSIEFNCYSYMFAWIAASELWRNG